MKEKKMTPLSSILSLQNINHKSCLIDDLHILALCIVSVPVSRLFAEEPNTQFLSWTLLSSTLNNYRRKIVMLSNFEKEHGQPWKGAILFRACLWLKGEGDGSGPKA